MKPIVRVIIPALNEEKSIDKVIKDIPADLVSEIIVIDNNSTDNTTGVAAQAGATTLKETEPGYGASCLKGINYIAHLGQDTDIIVFMDGDYSDFPEELGAIIEPILKDDVDLVIGSRALGESEQGSLTPVQIFGNWLSTRLLRLIYGVNFTDLGPFRAIKYQKLLDLGMKDRNYGWTVEMQLRAAKQGLKCAEVQVKYRQRIGKSKVSGTVKGSIFAGYKILFTIFRYM